MNRPARRTGRTRRAIALFALPALLAAFALTGATMYAQEGATQGDTTVAAGAAAEAGRAIDVTADPPGALVYLDGELIGAAPLRIGLDDVHDRGRDFVVLSVVGGDARRWFVPVITDSVRVPPGRSGGDAGGAIIARHYELPLPLRVTSEPAGAEVLLGDSVLGTTPLLTMVPRSVSRLDIRMDGYEPQSAMVRDGISAYRIGLVPRGTPAPDPRSPLLAEPGKSYAPVFIAAGSAVAAGAAAAWLKHLADRSYEEYRSTGDGATLDRVRRYDIISGISLAVAEIALGYLVIELLSR